MRYSPSRPSIRTRSDVFVVRCLPLDDGAWRVEIERAGSGDKTNVTSLEAAAAWILRPRGVLPSNGLRSGYIQGMIDHAGFAAQAPDSTDPIKQHARDVEICGENTRGRVTEIRDRALKNLQARSAADPRDDVLQVLARAEQAIHGVDLNGDGQISPVPGEGGVLTAYPYAQMMASIPLAPAVSGVAVIPNAQVQPSAIAATPAPVASPTSAPARAQPSSQVVIPALMAVMVIAAIAALRGVLNLAAPVVGAGSSPTLKNAAGS